MKHGIKLNEDDYDVALSRSLQGYRLHVGERSLPFAMQAAENGGYVLRDTAGAAHLAAAVDGDQIHIHLEGETFTLHFEHALQRLAEINEASTADVIKATMPGSLISLQVTTGDHVKQGQTLLVMESMKMETTIVAPRDGVIAELRVEPGQTFDKDAVLLSLEPEEE